MTTVPGIIEKKSKESLNEEEIALFVEAIYKNGVDDAQLGAFLMAVFINDMTKAERVSLTKEMTKYGDRFEWDDSIKNLVVDKHSTGGVGDKISLILTPAVVTCGAKIPMISGRGLGFTGGTLDKLESIPGYQVEMSIDDLKRAVYEDGFFIAGQTSNLAPVDKKMYAARDRTGTVDSLPLIIGSIMSKKAVEGLRGLILDVKVGNSALMKTRERAENLAKSMIEVGTAIGMKTTAFLTHMNNPIGVCIGNFLEIIETLWILNGHSSADIQELIEVQGAKMLQMTEIEEDFKAGRQSISNSLRNGTALAKFCSLMKRHNVDADLAEALCKPGYHAIEEYFRIIKRPMPNKHEIRAQKSGTVIGQNALALGTLSWNLGAGRSKKSDPLDYYSGIHLMKKPGDTVVQGESWAIIYHNRPLPSDFETISDSLITIEDIDPSTFKSDSMVITML